MSEKDVAPSTEFEFLEALYFYQSNLIHQFKILTLFELILRTINCGKEELEEFEVEQLLSKH